MTTSTSGRLTPTQWLICAIAAIGFAFDIYEILMLPLIVRPALLELVGAAPGSPEYQMWVGRLFYVPAFAGGIFGLLGGYLTDLFGRRRVLTFSILLYALAAFASGFATSIGMLLFFRCLVFIGVCVEFVAAVAWVAELFTDPRQREKALGYTQAFSSLGGLLVATANGICVALAPSLPALGAIFGGTIADPHAAWRYTVMSGVLPAIPLIIIRPFLPESPAWERKRAAGTLRRPSIAELFSPELRRTTIVTTLMFAMSYGAAFGAIQQIPQIVPGLPEVKAQTAGKPLPEARRIEQTIASDVTKVQEIGGLIGRTALAYLAVVIVSRRRLLRLFQVPGLIVMPFVFAWAATTGLSWIYAGIFLAGFFTVAQFSFWGNYLPRVYPTHLRGTGESFAANIGGRLFGTSFAWVTATLAVTPDRAYAPTKLALVAAAVGFSVYLVGFVASFFLPEPRGVDLPE
ncbi:MAG TPA: MFS transporter [Vicinamibacterales bacterium]|jgi:MFS family permease|nr:MFS transporter [Vicinamibacterales bacterium]